MTFFFGRADRKTATTVEQWRQNHLPEHLRLPLRHGFNTPRPHSAAAARSQRNSARPRSDPSRSAPASHRASSSNRVPRSSPWFMRGRQARQRAPFDERLDIRRRQHVAQMVRRHIRIRKCAVHRQPALAVQPGGLTPVTQHLVGKARRVRPQPERAFPRTDPRRPVCQRRRAEALLERRPVRRQRRQYLRRAARRARHRPSAARQRTSASII